MAVVRAFERLVLDPAARHGTLVDALRAARASILVTVFRCDDAPFIEALVDARARGVEVDVLLVSAPHLVAEASAWLALQRVPAALSHCQPHGVAL